MINVKPTTKAWSTAEQTSSLKSSGEQRLSAAEREKVLGDQDLGTYLNKLSDPNYVDPAKLRRVGNPDLDKDAFLKLFLAQLKNQDPTNPMQSHEMAAQLAQFSSLEKLSDIDSGIEAMSKANDPNKGFDALSMIGKGVGGDSSRIIRTDAKDTHEVTFTLGAPASEVTLSIRNAQGQEIKKLVARNLKEGANRVAWDGMIESGSTAAVGDYNIVIDAKGTSGQKIAAETRFEGRVTGVNYTAEGPVLMIGKHSVKLKDVKRIFETSDDAGQAKLVQAEAQIGKDAKNLASNAAGMGGNLENVGMSQGLINKLEKEANKSNASQGRDAEKRK